MTTITHDEDFCGGQQKVIYQSNFNFLDEVTMRGFENETETMETSTCVVAKFTIKPKDFSTTIFNTK